MPAVANWLTADSTAPLGGELSLLTRKWTLKSHLILCFMERFADKWGDDDFPEAVLPPMTLARQLFQEDIRPSVLRMSASPRREPQPRSRKYSGIRP